LSEKQRNFRAESGKNALVIQEKMWYTAFVVRASGHVHEKSEMNNVT